MCHVFISGSVTFREKQNKAFIPDILFCNFQRFVPGKGFNIQIAGKFHKNIIKWDFKRPVSDGKTYIPDRHHIHAIGVKKGPVIDHDNTRAF